MKRGPHSIGGKTIEVSLCEPVMEHPNVEHQRAEKQEPACSIKVKGLSKINSLDTLEFYFENEKRSGGGSIKRFETHEEEDYATITFETEEGIDYFSLKYVFFFKV